MDINAKELERKIKQDLSRWEKLWHKVDYHGKKVADQEVNELNILNQYIADYKRQGKLEDISDKWIVGRYLHKIKEVFARRNMDVDTLKVSYMERPMLDRELYEQDGINEDDLRVLRLSYQGNSFIIGPILHRIKNWRFERKVNKEFALVKDIYDRYYVNKYDRSFNNRMIENCMENLEPLLAKRLEIKEIINRNGKWHIAVTYFKPPLIPIPIPILYPKRHQVPVDEKDISDLAELNVIRNGIVQPNSLEERKYFMNMYDDLYKDELTWRARELGIEMENDRHQKVNDSPEKVNDGGKIYNLQAFMDGVEEEKRAKQEEKAATNTNEKAENSRNQSEKIAGMDR